jgi:hypothetical protein
MALPGVGYQCLHPSAEARSRAGAIAGAEVERAASGIDFTGDHTKGEYSMDQERLNRMQRADEIDLADGSPDELDELIAEFTAKDPNFPRLVEEAMERQTLVQTLIEERKR